jgi:hypothetical protein
MGRRQVVPVSLPSLEHHLISHAQAEDRARYSVIARVMGATEVTATKRATTMGSA